MKGIVEITGFDMSEDTITKARKRIDNEFVVGKAEDFEFDDSSFDTVFYVATLEFVTDYKYEVREAWGVTRPHGRLLVIMLNPESQYFHERTEDKDSYFRKVIHTNVEEIKDYISKPYHIMKEEYFLVIKGEEVFETSDKNMQVCI